MELLTRLSHASHSKFHCLPRKNKLRTPYCLYPGVQYCSSYNSRQITYPYPRCRLAPVPNSLSSTLKHATNVFLSFQRPTYLCPTSRHFSSTSSSSTTPSEKEEADKKSQLYRENIWTIPNILCVGRVALCPYLGYLVIQANYPTALGVFIFAGITDLLDGWIARNFKNQASLVGSFLDPMADKLLIGTLFITLTYVELIPGLLTGLIITRDVLLMASGFYIRYVSLPPPKTLQRYFDLGRPTAQLSPTFISKINTALQLALVATTLGAPIAGYVDHPVLTGLWYTIAGTTILSGLSYLFAKNTYTILKDKRKW